MKTTFIRLAVVASLAIAPLAFGVEPEKSPGKDSTTTTAPQPKTPAATDPVASTGSAETPKVPGKESTTTTAPIPPKDPVKKDEAK